MESQQLPETPIPKSEEVLPQLSPPKKIDSFSANSWFSRNLLKSRTQRFLGQGGVGDVPGVLEERPDLAPVIESASQPPPPRIPQTVVTAPALNIPVYDHRVVVIRRPGNGLGDLVDILAGVQGIVDQDSTAEVHLRSISPICTIAERHPAIAKIHTSDHTLPAGAEVIDLQVVCPAKRSEATEARPSRDRISLFAYSMGVDNPGLPKIYLAPEEQEWAKLWMRQRFINANGVLALVWQTRTRYKDYPYIDHLYNLLKCSQNIVVIEHCEEVPGVNTNGLTIRQQAAIIEQCRLVITGDTGWLHVAGALRRPIFGLYGSQNPTTRQGPFGVPGSHISGCCPHGRQPCWERTCLPADQYQPCMKFSAIAAERLILDLLEVIP